MTSAALCRHTSHDRACSRGRRVMAAEGRQHSLSRHPLPNVQQVCLAPQACAQAQTAASHTDQLIHVHSADCSSGLPFLNILEDLSVGGRRMQRWEVHMLGMCAGRLACLGVRRLGRPGRSGDAAQRERARWRRERPSRGRRTRARRFSHAASASSAAAPLIVWQAW